jgi:hypothetical protein
VPPDRWTTVWADRGDEPALSRALNELRARTVATDQSLPLESTP